MNRREPRPISGVRYKDSVKGKWARGDAGLRPSASLWVSLVRCALPLIAASLLTACGSDPHLSFLDPQGPVADAQRWHFYEVLGVMTVLVAGPIFLLLPFFAWRYRYGNKTRKYTPTPAGSVQSAGFRPGTAAHSGDWLRLEMAFYLSRSGDCQHRHVGRTGRAPFLDALDLCHGHAITVHSCAGQSDLQHGRNGHAVESSGQSAGSIPRREHHVQR